MARIELEFEKVQLENEDGRLQPGVRATCPECGESAEAFGTGPRSRMRCLMRLKEDCTEVDRKTGRSHYYVDPEADEGGRPPDPVPKKWWEK
jgi:tRNA(Ile2) C34 agmatinyltransferase TiaS